MNEPELLAGAVRDTGGKEHAAVHALADRLIEAGHPAGDILRRWLTGPKAWVAPAVSYNGRVHTTTLGSKYELLLTVARGHVVAEGEPNTAAINAPHATVRIRPVGVPLGPKYNQVTFSVPISEDELAQIDPTSAPRKLAAIEPADRPGDSVLVKVPVPQPVPEPQATPEQPKSKPARGPVFILPG